MARRTQIWCHRRLLALSDRAFRAYVNAIAYSAGMGSKGVLTLPQQRLLGARDRERSQLLKVGLWEPRDEGAIYIHDWEEHNGKRDERGQGYVSRVADTTWLIEGVGHFDSDAKADILWRQSDTGDVHVWLMNGNTIIDQGWVGRVGNLSWEIVGVGAFDGDTKEDVLWRKNDTGEVQMWFMNGKTIASQGYVGRVADTAWLIEGVGHFDTDTKADILWRKSNTGDVQVWLMNANTISDQGWLGRVGDLNWRIEN